MPEAEDRDDGKRSPPERDRDLEFWIQAALKGAKSLHSQLPLTNIDFTGVASTTFRDGRSYYLYAAADEIMKAAVAMMRWKEFLSETEPKEALPDGTDKGHLDRLVNESVLDEQRLWERKLTEWLINLVCFKSTNEQEYYRLFLATEAYDWSVGRVHDLLRYYSCPSDNAEIGARCDRDSLAAEIENTDSQRCWFLRREVFKKLPTRPGRLFTSIAERLSTALQFATPDEQVALGITYGHGFGWASESVHPKTLTREPVPTWRDVRRLSSRVGLVAINVTHRAHRLAGIAPTGMAKGIAAVLDGSSPASDMLCAVHSPGYEPGDIVKAMGHLAEVLDKRVSKYGLESYKVRFLVRGPLKETPEDWVPANATRAIVRRSWGRPYMESAVKRMPEILQHFPSILCHDDAELMAAFRSTLTDLEQQGLPIPPLGPPPPAEPSTSEDSSDR